MASPTRTEIPEEEKARIRNQLIPGFTSRLQVSYGDLRSQIRQTRAVANLFIQDFGNSTAPLHIMEKLAEMERQVVQMRQQLNEWNRKAKDSAMLAYLDRKEMTEEDETVLSWLRGCSFENDWREEQAMLENIDNTLLEQERTGVRYRTLASERLRRSLRATPELQPPGTENDNETARPSTSRQR